MSTTKTYMLIFRGTDWYQGLSPEEIQKVSDQMMAWFTGLKTQGKVLTGAPLESRGKLISGKNGQVIDGPFAESKEAIGGYFLLEVGDLDEAVEIARQCPGLACGGKVEVRPVAEECPLQSKARKQREETLAMA